MKVWIVLLGMDQEGEWILGVFASRDAARVFAQERLTKMTSAPRAWVEVYKDRWGSGSNYMTVEGWEVQE